jgi:hypothetical protein
MTTIPPPGQQLIAQQLDGAEVDPPRRQTAHLPDRVEVDPDVVVDGGSGPGAVLVDRRDHERHGAQPPGADRTATSDAP